MTEDAFISATLSLSTKCLGGIDAHLSEVSSDFHTSDEEEDEEEGGGVGGMERGDKGQLQREVPR